MKIIRRIIPGKHKTTNIITNRNFQEDNSVNTSNVAWVHKNPNPSSLQDRI